MAGRASTSRGRLAGLALLLGLAVGLTLTGCKQDDAAFAPRSTVGAGSPSPASAADALGTTLVDSSPLPPATVASMAASPTGHPASMPTIGGSVPPPPVLEGVATTPAAGASAAPSAQLVSVRSQLETVLTNAAACSTDAECKTVATGAKACGGPSGYRAYSSQLASSATVDALAQKERDLSLIEARDTGRVSACFMLADPGAHCEARTCVTGSPVARAGGDVAR